MKLYLTTLLSSLIPSILLTVSLFIFGTCIYGLLEIELSFEIANNLFEAIVEVYQGYSRYFTVRTSPGETVNLLPVGQAIFGIGAVGVHFMRKH